MQQQLTEEQKIEPSTPNSGNKRSRQPSQSPETPLPKLPTSSPVGHTPKKLMMATGNKPKSQTLDLETMKNLLAPIKQQLTELAEGQATLTESVPKIEKSVTGMLQDIQKLQFDVERLKKQLLSKSLMVYGIQEKPNETYKDIDKEVGRLSTLLGLRNIDYDIARRVGKPVKGKSRPIELILVRQRDKMEILSAKTKLGGNPDAKNIYISTARTQAEQKRYKKLLEFAQNKKSQDLSIKFRFKRGDILEITEGTNTSQYYVDSANKVIDYNNKRGEAMDQGLSHPFRAGSP